MEADQTDPRDAPDGDPAPIRRGQGLRLSVDAAPPDSPPPDQPAGAGEPELRRGQGLRLSVDAAPPGDGAATPGETAAPQQARLRLGHGEISYWRAGGGPPLLL